MALRKPIVLNSGQYEQIQAGDILDATVNSAEVISLTNDNAGSVVCGAPVYMTANSHFDKAKADAVGTVEVIGLVKDTSIATATAGIVQTDGILALTTGQWDAVTGDVGGLTFGSNYYLDAATAGKLTKTAPSTTGQFVKSIGIAISATEIKLNIERRVKL